MSVSPLNNNSMVRLKNGVHVPDDGTIKFVTDALDVLSAASKFAIRILKIKCHNPNFQMGAPFQHEFSLLKTHKLVMENGELPEHYRNIILSALGKFDSIQDPRA